MTCCEQLPDYLEASNQSEPFKSMDRLHVYREAWCHLMKCPNFEQLWVVDEWDKYQLLVSLKVTNAPSDEEVINLVKEYREKLFVDKQGGYSDETCMWAGCSNPAAKGKKLCYKHLR